MDILDEKRLLAITPLFEYYGLQDVVSVLRQTLIDIRIREYPTVQTYPYYIDKWICYFYNSVNAKLCHHTRMLVCKKIEEIYPNFDISIYGLLEQSYSEYLKHKVTLDLTGFVLIDNKLTFNISINQFLVQLDDEFAGCVDWDDLNIEFDY